MMMRMVMIITESCNITKQHYNTIETFDNIMYTVYRSPQYTQYTGHENRSQQYTGHENRSQVLTSPGNSHLPVALLYTASTLLPRLSDAS